MSLNLAQKISALVVTLLVPYLVHVFVHSIRSYLKRSVDRNFLLSPHTKNYSIDLLLRKHKFSCRIYRAALIDVSGVKFKLDLIFLTEPEWGSCTLVHIEMFTS